MKSRALAFGLGLAVGVAAMILYGLVWEDHSQAVFVVQSGKEPWLSWPS